MSKRVNGTCGIETFDILIKIASNLAARGLELNIEYRKDNKHGLESRIVFSNDCNIFIGSDGKIYYDNLSAIECVGELANKDIFKTVTEFVIFKIFDDLAFI